MSQQQEVDVAQLMDELLQEPLDLPDEQFHAMFEQHEPPTPYSGVFGCQFSASGGV